MELKRKRRLRLSYQSEFRGSFGHRKRPDKVQSFCNQFETKVAPGQIDDLKKADIICTATTSSDPLFDFANISKGTHINAVGAMNKQKRITHKTHSRRKSLR